MFTVLLHDGQIGQSYNDVFCARKFSKVGHAFQNCTMVNKICSDMYLCFGTHFLSYKNEKTTGIAG